MRLLRLSGVAALAMAVATGPAVAAVSYTLVGLDGFSFVYTSPDFISTDTTVGFDQLTSVSPSLAMFPTSTATFLPAFEVQQVHGFPPVYYALLLLNLSGGLSPGTTNDYYYNTNDFSADGTFNVLNLNALDPLVVAGTPDVSVPEPVGLAAFGSGVLGVMFAGRRRIPWRRRAQPPR